MDTELLRTFLVVARRQSFTAAAGELHLVQSTVTSRVKALERQVGVRLLDRVPGARLTEAGARLLPIAGEMLDLERRLLAEASPSDLTAGEVVLGAPESVCAYRRPGHIAQLRRSHPDVTLHLVAAGTEETFRGLLDRHFDIGLVLDDQEPPAPLAGRQVGAEAVDVVAGTEHPAATRRPSWQEIGATPLYLLAEGCSYSDRFLDEVLRRAGRTAAVTRFGSIEAARACVEAGLGLSVLPRVALEAGGRTLVRLPVPRPEERLVLVTHRSRWRSAAVRAVQEALTAAAAAGWSART